MSNGGDYSGHLYNGIVPFTFNGTTYKGGSRFGPFDACTLLQFMVAARAVNPDRGFNEEGRRTLDEAARRCAAQAATATPAPAPPLPAPDESDGGTGPPELRGDTPDRQGAPPAPPGAGTVEREPDPLAEDPPPEEEPERPPEGLPDPNARERGQQTTTGADPVDLFTGEFRLTETDLSVPDTVMPLTFVRSYRSGPGTMGPLGWNWEHNYHVYVRELTSGDVALWRDQHEVVFTASGAGYASPRGVFVLLERVPGPQDRWRTTAPGGAVMEFARPPGWSDPERVPAVLISDRHGNRLELEYGQRDHLERVVEVATGHHLRLRYDECGLLVSVADHSGRRWDYRHDEERLHLTHVLATPTPDQPEGSCRRYEYAPLGSHSGLRHGIVRIVDGAGRTYLENEYEADPGAWSFGRVTQQLVGGHLFQLCYTQLQWVPPREEMVDVPALRVQVRAPDLGLETYTFNYRGEVLDQRYRLVRDGSFRVVAWQYSYDVEGNLLETVRPDGGREVLTYDSTSADPRARGNLLRRELRPSPLAPAPSRVVARYRYDAALQLLVEQVDEHGARTHFRYDTELAPGDPASTGRLMRIDLPDATLPDGTVQQARVALTYLGNGQVESMTDPTGSRTLLEYGTGARDGGRVVRRTSDTDGLAAVEEFNYDDAGFPVSRTTPEGHVYSMDTDALGRVTGVRLPDVGGSTAETRDHFDADGFLVRRELPRGAYSGGTGNHIVDELERDVLGHVVAVRRAANTPELRETRVCRDFRGLPVRVTHPDGSREYLRYDERGLLVRHRHQGADGTTSEARRVYDRVGRLVLRAEADGTETRYEYDGFGRLRLERRSNGSATRHTWDGDNATATEVTGPDGTGTERVLRRERSTFDERGRRVTRVAHVFTTDPNNFVEIGRTVEHDAVGREVRVTDHRGAVTETDYDGLGRVVARRLPDGNRETYDYDLDSNLVRQVEHHREPDGRVVAYTREFEADSRGRRTAVVEPDGARRETEWDDRDRAVGTVDPLGTVTADSFDAHGQLRTRTVDPTGLALIQRWERDVMGRVTAYTDPDGQRSTYRYDGLGRVREVQYPTGHRSEVTRDARGLPETERLATGAVLRFQHDAHARLTRLQTVTVPAPLVAVPDTSYGYDGLDRLVVADDGAHPVERDYDSVGRMVAERSSGVELTYAYDDAAGRVVRSWPDGRQEVLEHDLTGTLTEIRQVAASALGSAAGTLASFTKSGPESPATVNYASGVTTSMNYDERKRLVQLGISGPGDAAGHLRYFYDGADRIGAREEDWGGGAAITAYDFDQRSRLLARRGGLVGLSQPVAGKQGDHDTALAAIRGGAPGAPDVETFGYGAADQRLAATGPSGVQSFTYSPGHRPASDGTLTYAFAADGTLRTAGDLTTEVDALGRVVTLRRGGLPVYHLGYDPLGRPVSVAEAGRPVRTFAYFGAFIEQEMDDGAAVRQVTRQPGSGMALAVHDAGRTLVPLYDARHSLRLVTDLAGDIVETVEYRAFGAPTVRDAAGAVLLRSAVGIHPVFGGQDYLPGVGLYLSRRRLYDPEAGIYLSMDPRGYGDSPSLYVYAAQDPVNDLDPHGEVVPFIVAALVIGGALAGAGYSVYDAYHHPERYEGVTGGLRAFGNTIGGALIGGLAALAAEAVLAYGGIGALAAPGTATTLTTAQTFTLYGTASAASGIVTRGGFNSLFPEYVDPVTAESIAADFVIGGGIPVVGSAVAPYVTPIARGARDYAVVAVRSIGNGAMLRGAREMATRAWSGNWRLFGNNWNLVRNGLSSSSRVEYTLRNLIWDPRSFKAVSAQYWSRSGGADGKVLHHLWFQNQSEFIPQGLRNAAVNHLEIPRSLNTWMGGRIGREWTFRGIVVGVLGTTFAGSYTGTQALLGLGEDPPGDPDGASPQRPNDIMRSK